MYKKLSETKYMKINIIHSFKIIKKVKNKFNQNGNSKII